MKGISIMFLLYCLIGSVNAQSQMTELPDSTELELKFPSFSKITNTYSQGESLILRKEFVDIMSRKEQSLKKYKSGRQLRIASAVVATVSAASIVYFTDQYIKDENAFNPSKELVLSYMGLMGGAILNYYGKGKIQVAINEYNGNIISKENPFRINISGGKPAFGLWSTGDGAVNQDRAFGIGMEAHLYKRVFGYVDAYNQQATTTFPNTSSGVLRWDEKGNSVVLGLGLDYEIYKRVHLVGKYGWGITTIDREVSFDNKLFNVERNEISQATQLGVGFRYFLVDHFAIGSNINLATSTPLYNFGITGAF